MSKPRPDLKNDIGTLQRYVEWLSNRKQVDSVYLAGSRSPLREKQPNDSSDWDLIAFTKLEKLTLPMPRKQFKFHCDLLIVNVGKKERYKTAVEIWPNDKYEILNG